MNSNNDNNDDDNSLNQIYTERFVVRFPEQKGITKATKRVFRQMCSEWYVKYKVHRKMRLKENSPGGFMNLLHKRTDSRKSWGQRSARGCVCCSLPANICPAVLHCLSEHTWREHRWVYGGLVNVVYWCCCVDLIVPCVKVSWAPLNEKVQLSSDLQMLNVNTFQWMFLLCWMTSLMM